MAKWLEPLDLGRNELQNAVMQNLATAPQNPVVGLTYFDTTLEAERVWDGSKWVDKGGLSPEDRAKLDGIETGATKNATDAQLRDRATHTGSQAINTVTGLQNALDSKINTSARGAANGVASLDANTLVPPAQLPDATTSVKGAMTAADKTKLNGIASGATANQSDAHLLNRANHTGMQAISTITNLQTALDAKLDASLRGAANGVASLDGDGKIPNNQLPQLAITETFEVSSQAAMLALTAQEGDVAIRTDLSKSFILSQSPASTLANWKELLTPAGGVQNITGAAPITSSGGSSPSIGITDATTSARGAMTAADKTKLNGIATGATANSTDAQLRDRGTHTGTQSLDTTTDSSARLAMTPAERTKLAGIASGATANEGTVRKVAASVGGSTSSVVTHNLNTRDVQVEVWETSGNYEKVYPGIRATTVNSVTITFATAPPANSYRVVVTG